MSPLIYALHIATLALWVSLAGLDVVGWVLPIWRAEPKSSRAMETAAVLPPPEISLGEPTESVAESTPGVALETLPTPPEPPAISEFSPLPELPEVPAKPTAPAVQGTPKNPASQAARQTDTKPEDRTQGAAGSVVSGPSAAARMAAGQMPPPIYPPEARRHGQTGTVLVEFVVGTDGRVISASPKNPSPWPLLNNEALRTVRGWKFLPGAVMRLQRPIVFQLK
ncbi:MAG: TonB family protein [Verrucomicrobiota bacterium]